MVIVIGSVTIEDGHIEEALAASLEHVRRSRTEPGCISHAVHRDAENPNRLVFVEEWKDQASLQQHFRVPASIAFVKALKAIAIGAPRIGIYDAKVQQRTE